MIQPAGLSQTLILPSSHQAYVGSSPQVLTSKTQIHSDYIHRHAGHLWIQNSVAGRIEPPCIELGDNGLRLRSRNVQR